MSVAAFRVYFSQVLNDLELAGQAILVKVGKKEQPALEAFLTPKDDDAGKRHQTLVDAVKTKVGQAESTKIDVRLPSFGLRGIWGWGGDAHMTPSS